MKLLSIQNIFNGAKRVVVRFPVAMLVAAVGTGIGLYLVNFDVDMTSVLLNTLLTLSLAAPLFVAGVLLSEAKSFKPKMHWITHSIVLLFLVVYYYLLPDMDTAVSVFYIRHAMWVFGFVLVVTFVPFFFQKQEGAVKRFWQYNRGLIFAAALTVVWAMALMAGISVAFGSIDFLFGIDIEEEVYQSLWFILVGLFAPLFFLSRLPEKPHKLEDKRGYPKEVRLFSQYVLVPLVTMYFLILYAYTIKIIALFDWPEGQLAWMILGFSFLGVLTYLALHPLREKEKWIRYFGTGLFAAMIPQIGMLFWALSFRLRDYGFTENRYFVLVFGIWLLAMAVYYLVARVKDIRVISVSLFVLAVLTSFGPWGAFSVAERSQVNRLEGILVENGLLQNGLYVQLSVEISAEDQHEIEEIVKYLLYRHGLDSIEHWFGGEDLDSLGESRYETRTKVLEEKFGIDVNSFNRLDYEAKTERFRLISEHLEMIPVNIEGYEYSVAVDVNWSGGSEFVVDGIEYRIDFSEDGRNVELRKNGVVVASFWVYSLVETVGDIEGRIPVEDMVLRAESGEEKYMFLVEDLMGEDEEGVPNIEVLEGVLYLTQ